MARKIASVFSRPDRHAQQTLEARNQSTSVPASQKYVTPTALIDADDSPVSTKKRKQTESSHGTDSHGNGKGPAQQRVS